MDQVMTFLGQHEDLAAAIAAAQAAANQWLRDNARAVGTIYGTTSQSIWHEHAHTGAWYHVITLTLDLREPGGSGDDLGA